MLLFDQNMKALEKKRKQKQKNKTKTKTKQKQKKLDYCVIQFGVHRIVWKFEWH